MSPYDGPDGDDFPPDGEASDMITINPPRWQRWRPGRPITVAGVAVVALAAGGGVGYAATHSITTPAADTAAVSAASTPAPTPSPVAPAPGSHQGRGFRGFGGGIPGGPARFAPGPIGGGLIHGEFTVPKSGGGYQTLDVQQGTVTAVSATSVTVKSADGYSVTYTVTSKTLVDAQAAGIGSVKKGDSLFVTATVSGTTPTATNIIDLTAVKAGHASFGFRGAPPNPPSAKTQPAQQKT
jgi:hypothetical protein